MRMALGEACTIVLAMDSKRCASGGEGWFCVDSWAL